MMYEWHRQIQLVVDKIDECILRGDDKALTLRSLSMRLGYSQYHTTRKFRRLSGMSLRDYLRLRRLAFALIEVRDTRRSFLEIGLDYGFSSHEAFTRAFKSAYGITPKSYRKNPVPVMLRTKITVFDRYILGIGEIGMIKSSGEVKIYYASIPAHKFLHIKNYESAGYWDFWDKQDKIPSQDCDTICGVLDSIKGKLDGNDNIIGEYSGQIMAHINECDGRCPEAYGIRLPQDYSGAVPDGMLLIDVPDAEYIVFEHGPFDYEQESESVGEKLAEAIRVFSFDGVGYAPDDAPGRVAYFYHDPKQFEKRIRPVKKASSAS